MSELHAKLSQPLESEGAKGKARPLLNLKLVNSWSLPSLDVEAAAGGVILDQRDLSQLRIVTWNIWFDDLASQHRLSELLREILAAAPDVACLQEIRGGVADALRNSTSLCTLYDISPCDVGVYGNLTLVRKDLEATFTLIPLPTEICRNLLLAECHARLPHLAVANVHLESLDSEVLRKEQLAVARTVLSNWPHAVLCGDFNFDACQTYGDWKLEAPHRSQETLENRVLSDLFPEFVDAWPAVRDEPGFTFDGLLNQMCVEDRYERMRYDRVLARAGQPGLQTVDAALLGTKEITDWGVMPSDHFGLQVDFSIHR